MTWFGVSVRVKITYFIIGPRTLQLKLQKSRYRPYTLQLFFTTAKIFSTVLYIGNDFYNNFFPKIVVKIFIVCEGLNGFKVHVQIKLNDDDGALA